MRDYCDTQICFSPIMRLPLSDHKAQSCSSGFYWMWVSLNLQKHLQKRLISFQSLSENMLHFHLRELATENCVNS